MIGRTTLKNGREGYVAEASGELAEKIRDMKLKVDTPVLVNLSFDYQEVTKDNVVRYFQRVRIEDFVAEIVFNESSKKSSCCEIWSDANNATRDSEL